MTPKFNRPIRDAAPPASSCARCFTSGVLAHDQTRSNGNKLTGTLRFECPNCLHIWLTDKPEALQHGAFLRRIDPGTRNDQ